MNLEIEMYPSNITKRKKLVVVLILSLTRLIPGYLCKYQTYCKKQATD